MWWNCYWWGYFGLGPLAWMIQIGLWGLAFWGIFYLFSRLRNHSSGDLQKTEDPMFILKRRFALGEISGEEFKRMKMDL
ncbi:MAG: SHOCT domain-containing protein [Deltaproteobacteria bacterium]|nr:SHOCT domain-containing protein [Deltaproteobacteria bacterium]